MHSYKELPEWTKPQSKAGMSFHAEKQEHNFIPRILISDTRGSQIVAWKPHEAFELFRVTPSHPSMDVGCL